MLERKTIFILGLIVLILIGSFFIDGGNLTGFITLEQGVSLDLGRQTTGNPKFGIVYGYVLYTITDAEDNELNTEVPDEQLIVYFVPSGIELNWTAEPNCTEEIEGDITDLDSDANGTQCVSYNYTSPTAQECEAYTTEGDLTSVYLVNTTNVQGNLACFAGKIKADEYDIYV